MEIGSLSGWLAIGAVITFILAPIFWFYIFKREK